MQNLNFHSPAVWQICLTLCCRGLVNKDMIYTFSFTWGSCYLLECVVLQECYGIWKQTKLLIYILYTRLHTDQQLAYPPEAYLSGFGCGGISMFDIWPWNFLHVFFSFLLTLCAIYRQKHECFKYYIVFDVTFLKLIELSINSKKNYGCFLQITWILSGSNSGCRREWSHAVLVSLHARARLLAHVYHTCLSS